MIKEVKFTKKIGEKKDMRYDIHNKENTETNLHFLLCIFGFIETFMNLQN